MKNKVMYFLKENLCSNRGSSIIEAAVVMPCIILSLISIVIITVNTCQICIGQCVNHRTLLEEASKPSSFLSKTFVNMKTAYMSSKQVGEVHLQDRIYVIDERKTIMYKDFFNENIV